MGTKIKQSNNENKLSWMSKAISSQFKQWVCVAEYIWILRFLELLPTNLTFGACQAQEPRRKCCCKWRCAFSSFCPSIGSNVLRTLSESLRNLKVPTSTRKSSTSHLYQFSKLPISDGQSLHNGFAASMGPWIFVVAEIKKPWKFRWVPWALVCPNVEAVVPGSVHGSGRTGRKLSRPWGPITCMVSAISFLNWNLGFVAKCLLISGDWMCLVDGAFHWVARITKQVALPDPASMAAKSHSNLTFSAWTWIQYTWSKKVRTFLGQFQALAHVTVHWGSPHESPWYIIQ